MLDITTTQYRPINVSQARNIGMIPVSTIMKPGDYHLATIERDMRRVPGTNWAYVQESYQYIAIWRIPSPFHKYEPEKRKLRILSRKFETTPA